MKLAILLTAIFMANTVLAKSVTRRKIDDIERRLSVLENKVKMLTAQQSQAKSNETTLKVKDLKNNEVHKFSTRFIASDSKNDKLSEKQKDKVLKQIKRIKDNQEKSKEILDQTMNDDY